MTERLCNYIHRSFLPYLIHCFLMNFCLWGKKWMHFVPITPSIIKFYLTLKTLSLPNQPTKLGPSH